MTTKHRILCHDQPIGLVYISPHPLRANHKIGSIIPISRQGKWMENTAEIVFERAVFGDYPTETENAKIAEDLAGKAGIEWGRVTLVNDELV